MIAAIYALAILVLTIYGIQAGWLALKALKNQSRVKKRSLPDPPDKWPCVTVQLPVYNEAEVIEQLLDAVCRLDYPAEKLQIQLLDDSTDQTTPLARKRIRHWKKRGVEVEHVHRSTREGFKAGALQEGLETARGEFVAIFDADFLPKPDFLKRLIQYFQDDDVGMVQARWDHLNAEESGLTRAQAIGLDAHFAVEQTGRQAASYFINFNGTAGVWRRACIKDAGEWESDTLTEDLDLSYRAQLAGWRLQYIPSYGVSAELPRTMEALRTQQARWARGGIETARKLVPRLFQSSEPVRTKVAGFLHLTSHLAYPALLVALLTHVPALYAAGEHAAGASTISQIYLAASSIGFIGFAGFLLAHAVTQKFRHNNWLEHLSDFPLFLIGTIGIACSNSVAVLRGLLKRDGTFLRTPKLGVHSNWERGPTTESISAIAWVEIALAFYGWLGVAVLVALGIWVAVPFQVAIAVGCTAVAGQDLFDRIAYSEPVQPARAPAEHVVG